MADAAQRMPAEALGGRRLWYAAGMRASEAMGGCQMTCMQLPSSAQQAHCRGDVSADDNAPAVAKTRWLATFYLCIPVGYALGYVFGGLVAGPLGWRAAFLLEAAAMLPFLAFCTFAPALDLRGAAPLL